MTLEELKKEFINGSTFTRMTGIAHVNWYRYFKRYGYVPIESQLMIEAATNGKLKASLDHIPKGVYR